MLVLAPGGNAPVATAGSMDSQLTLAAAMSPCATLQFKVAVSLFFKVNTRLELLKGPPATPLLMKAFTGVILNGEGDGGGLTKYAGHCGPEP